MQETGTTLRISPPDFTFAPSRTTPSTHVARIFLSYPTSDDELQPPLGYKFKTNAPARYSVKPVLGVIRPGARVEVYVRCDGGNVVPGDRFLLQVVALDAEEVAGLNAASWRLLEEHRLGGTFIPCRSRDIDSIPMSRNQNISTSSAKGTSGDSMPLVRKISSPPPKVPIVFVSCVCLLLGLLVPFHPFSLISHAGGSAFPDTPLPLTA